MTALALLPSPLLGSSVWDPVAYRLRGAGQRVIKVDLGIDTPGTAADVITVFLSPLPGRDLLLAPHSNFALYIPSLWSQRPVSAAPPELFLRLSGEADGLGGNLMRRSQLWCHLW